MARLLLIGASGQLGAEVRRARLPEGWEIEAPTRAALDLAAPATIAPALAALKPDLILNAAAYTGVDKAETEPDLAFALNRDGPAALARAAAARRIPLVHVSTDYVFDGKGAGPYTERDAKAPLGVYGRSKSEGEDAVLRAGGAVVRTSWVFSAHRANFVKTMLRLGETREEVAVVADQHGRPTAAADLAQVCITLGAHLLAGDEAAADVFHFANAGETTWADFAEAIFAGAQARGRKPVRVKPITTADYPTPAKRPANSRLDTAKIEAALHITPRPWRRALEECLDELLAR